MGPIAVLRQRRRQVRSPQLRTFGDCGGMSVSCHKRSLVSPSYSDYLVSSHEQLVWHGEAERLRLRRPSACAAPPSWGRHPQTFTDSEVASAVRVKSRQQTRATALIAPTFLTRMGRP